MEKAPRESSANLEADFRRRLHNQQKCVASESYRFLKRNLIGPNLPVGVNLVARALGDPIRWRYNVFLLNVKPFLRSDLMQVLPSSGGLLCWAANGQYRVVSRVQAGSFLMLHARAAPCVSSLFFTHHDRRG